jgi:hypothetical protein
MIGREDRGGRKEQTSDLLLPKILKQLAGISKVLIELSCMAKKQSLF